MSYKQSEKNSYFLLLFVVIIWGGTWPLARWMVTGTNTIPPLMIVIIRYALVVIVFIFLLYLKERDYHFSIVREHWKLLLVMSLLSVTIYQSAFLFGEQYTSASDASLMVATGPIWVLIVAPFLVRETLTKQKLLGAIIGFFGVAIIVGFSPNINVENRLLGDLLILIAAVVYGVYTVLLKYFFDLFDDENKPSSLFVISWISIFGFITTIPIALIVSPEFLSINSYVGIHIRIWLGIFYLAFLSTVLAYLAYIESVNRLGASRAAIFVLFVPVFGIAFSAIFLQEIIDPVIHLISFLCIMTGVILINRQSELVSESKPILNKPTQLVQNIDSNN